MSEFLGIKNQRPYRLKFGGFFCFLGTKKALLLVADVQKHTFWQMISHLPVAKRLSITICYSMFLFFTIPICHGFV
jgi:hypothetical protein